MCGSENESLPLPWRYLLLGMLPEIVHIVQGFGFRFRFWHFLFACISLFKKIWLNLVGHLVDAPILLISQMTCGQNWTLKHQAVSSNAIALQLEIRFLTNFMSILQRNAVSIKPKCNLLLKLSTMYNFSLFRYFL